MDPGGPLQRGYAQAWVVFEAMARQGRSNVSRRGLGRVLVHILRGSIKGVNALSAVAQCVKRHHAI